VVAEFVAGTGGTQSGLAYRILESGYQLRIPRMFAALLLISLSGIVLFLVLSLISHLCLAPLARERAPAGELTCR
jgi:NitT/TauT family transport system permease protein